MPSGARAIPKPKHGQYRAPCLCGCKSKSPTSIAAHGKAIARRGKIDSLALARSACHRTSPLTFQPAPTTQNFYLEPGNVARTAEDPGIEVDLPQASGFRDLSPPLTRVWADRASRREREDEDLVPEPDPSESSEDEDKVENGGNLEPDEHLSDESDD